MIHLNDLLDEDLRRWFKEKWTDQHGRPCGNDKTKGIKKCRPSKKVSADTPKTWSQVDKKKEVSKKRRVGMGNRTTKAEEVVLDEKKKTAKRDACYHKVKSRYEVWPSAYASAALSKCRNVGAKNWGNKSKKNESMEEMTICDVCAKSLLEDIRDGILALDINEAEYRGRKVKLNKPMRGDVKKFKVYVKDPKTGNVKKVNFGHGGTSAKKAGQKTMRIRKNNPKARKSFRARHNCADKKDKTTAGYWSCKMW